MFLRIGRNAVIPLDFRDRRPGSLIRPRQGAPNGGGGGGGGSPTNTTTIAVVAVVVGVLVVIFVLVVGHKKLKARGSKKIKYRRTTNDDDDSTAPGTRRSAPSTRNPNNRDSTATTNTTTSNVDRNTSVRSVMTLPAYRARASDGEQILGREGERDGIDVVLELPTAEREEELREQEMDALFQIRETRRQQIAEQEERRRARREARERQDARAIVEIRDQARAARTANPQAIDDLRDEHNRIKQTRQRAVSSVSYADLGVARHDGTRIRANSTESSERVGLLSDAASIAASQRSPSSLAHRRERSSSSVLTIDTDHTNGPPSPYLDTGGQSTGRRSRADSGATTPRYERTPTPSGRSRSHSAAGSSPEIIDAADADLGDMPPHSPPGYDDVSLDEITPMHSRSTSPYPDPPPDYYHVRPSTEERRSSYGQRLSVQGLGVTMPETDVTEMGDDEDDGRSSRAGVPRLPSLRLQRLPQIVIQPSSAAPRER